MIKSVTMKGPKAYMMVKIFTGVVKIKTLPRYSLLKGKSPDRKETKSPSKYVSVKL